MSSGIAQRYGQGLFELAVENQSVEAKKQQVDTLLTVLEENKDVEILLRAVKVSKDEKKAFMEKIFKGAVDQDVLSLIKLLIDNGRIYYFKDVLKEFSILADEKLGITHAIVQSARKLKEEDLERIQKAIEAKTKTKVVLKNRIDPSLIAGIKVSVGNHVTDITMKNKIERMKDALLKGGQA